MQDTADRRTDWSVRCAGVYGGPNKSTESLRSAGLKSHGDDARGQEGHAHPCMWPRLAQTANACMHVECVHAFAECICGTLSFPPRAAARAESSDKELCSMPSDTCSFHPRARVRGTMSKTYRAWNWSPLPMSRFINKMMSIGSFTLYKTVGRPASRV